MKTLLFILLIPVFGWGQTIQDHYRAYLSYCNDTVTDSITQYGEVWEREVPVYDNGVIVRYKNAPGDTAWVECNCPKYKRMYREYVGGLVDTIQVIYTHGLYYYPSGRPGYVSRQVKCRMLRENPSRDGFYEWLWKEAGR